MFTRHIHEGYALGVIEQGALAFSYRGERQVAPAGAINLVIPGVAHDGQAATAAGWAYRMFYLESDLLEQATYELCGKKRRPYFSAGVLYDAELARQILLTHRCMETEIISPLEQHSRLVSLLTSFISRYSEQKLELDDSGKDARAVERVRQYIEEHYAENVMLQQLIQISYLSGFHLIRLFRSTVGVPPHVFLKQVRIRRAKQLITQGMALAEAAQATGFVDQSHFARQFKQITGITPRQFSNSIQYGVASHTII